MKSQLQNSPGSFSALPLRSAVSDAPSMSRRNGSFRQHHGETYHLIPALRPNTSPVEFHNLLRDGQTQSGSAGTRGTGGIEAIKLFKDPLQLFLRNCLSMILTDAYDSGVSLYRENCNLPRF